MKQKLLLSTLIGVLSFSAFAEALELVRYGGDKEIVDVSNNSVSKFVFPSNILKKAYSKEKNLLIETDKNELYIKYSPVSEQEQFFDPQGKPIASNSGGKLSYKKAFRSELFVTTETGSYLFVLNPVSRDAETFKIVDPKADQKKAYEFETKDEYPETIRKLVALSFDFAQGTGVAPDGYNVKELKTEAFAYGSKTTVSPRYRLIGNTFDIYLFELKNITDEELTVDPKAFTRIPLKQKLAISPLDETIAPFQKTMLTIIVRHQDGGKQ